MHTIGRYTIKSIGWILTVGGAVAFLWHLWIFLDSTIHAIRFGQNSGTGLGEVFGIVGVFVFLGLTVLGVALIKKGRKM